MSGNAITTHYRGYRFRSRLEARWAVFFDSLGLQWEYEPEGYEMTYGWYLPDFLIPDKRMWVEVKGRTPTLNEYRKALELGAKTKCAAFIFIGMPKQGEELKYEECFSFLDAKIEIRLPENTHVEATLPLTKRYEEGWAVACPVCKNEEVYIEHGIEVVDDFTKQTILMHMQCGNSHRWAVSYRHDFGSTFFEIKNITVMAPSPNLYLADLDPTRLAAAYKAALSARFEHGETPD